MCTEATTVVFQAVLILCGVYGAYLWGRAVGFKEGSNGVGKDR
jgi:hypothetical protein